MKTKLTIIFSFALLLIFSGCKKEGPQGPAGKDANVKAQTFSVTSWADNGAVYYVNYSNSDITSGIQSSGTVDLFFSYDGGGTWKAVPFTYVSSTNYFMSYNTSIGNIQVIWTYNGMGLGSNPNSIYGNSAQFKVVCISAGARKSNPDLDWSNYSEIKNRFNIAD